MKAARCFAYDGPRAVRITDVDPPAPGPGQVLIDVDAAAVNFPDLLFLTDRYQVTVPLPFTVGSEFAGRVAAVGAGAGEWSPGDPVMGSVLSGAMAEQVVAEASRLWPVPVGLSQIEAAGFRVAMTTAYHALVTAGEMRAGQQVVVLGAGGGVGGAAVELARRMGARAVAVASTRDKLDAVSAEGVTGLVAARDGTGLKGALRNVTGGGADLVIDPVGGALAEPALRALRWGGRFVTIGYAAGEIPRIPLNLVLLKNLTLRGVELRTWHDRLPVESAQTARVLANLVAAGLRPHIGAVFGLADAVRALEFVESGRAVGKVVVDVSGRAAVRVREPGGHFVDTAERPMP